MCLNLVSHCIWRIYVYRNSEQRCFSPSLFSCLSIVFALLFSPWIRFKIHLWMLTLTRTATFAIFFHLALHFTHTRRMLIAHVYTVHPHKSESETKRNWYIFHNSSALCWSIPFYWIVCVCVEMWRWCYPPPYQTSKRIKHDKRRWNVEKIEGWKMPE